MPFTDVTITRAKAQRRKEEPSLVKPQRDVPLAPVDESLYVVPPPTEYPSPESLREWAEDMAQQLAAAEDAARAALQGWEHDVQAIEAALPARQQTRQQLEELTRQAEAARAFLDTVETQRQQDSGIGAWWRLRRVVRWLRRSQLRLQNPERESFTAFCGRAWRGLRRRLLGG
jgi:hypothetical protein